MAGAVSAVDEGCKAQRFSLLRQATPMVVSRAGLAAMAITDAVMVAHFSSTELAAASLAEGTFGRLADVFLAFIHAALVLIVAAAAASRQGDRLAIWQRALRIAMLMGFAGFVVALFAGPLLQLFAQPTQISDLAAKVILLLACGLPAGLMALACAIHLEAIGRAKLVASFMILANLLNVGGNWLLIEGHWGFPGLGVLGSAATTTIVRILLAIGLIVLVRWFEGPSTFAVQPQDPLVRRDHYKLGFTALGASAAMHLLGIWLTLFAGWLGPLPLAAFAAGWILNLPGLLLAAGIGDAIALRVAHRLTQTGEASPARAWSDLSVLALLLSPWVLLLMLAAPVVAGVYTPDPELRALMIKLLPMSGLVLMLDGLSYATSAALRGLKDIAVPTAIQVGAMIATPILAWFLAFWLGMGVEGILVAILTTSLARLSLLAFRMFLLFRPAPTGLIQLERETA